MPADVAASPVAAPAKPRRFNAVAVLWGLAAGPAGWALQLVLGYGLSSYACFPSLAPFQRTPPPGWGAERMALLGINLACLALIVAGGLVCLDAWRRSAPSKGTDANTPGVDAARASREHFLASCGLLGAGGFAFATLFNTYSLLFTATCWRFWGGA
jgi:hypothetical protein